MDLINGEVFYLFYTARKTNSDNQLVRKDIDVNEHERLSNSYIQYINEPTSNNIKQSNVLTIYLVGTL
jgi:hypothetical protein